MNTKISVQFLGGVASNDNLTGSCNLLTVKQGKRINRILIDIGLIQTNIKKLFNENLNILNRLDPKNINAIILTHSHIDHVGRLPLLVKNGFGKQGKVFCTKATAKILPIMLEDSAKIQALDANHLNKSRTNRKQKNLNGDRSSLRQGKYDRRYKKQKVNRNKTKVKALYDHNDVEASMNLIKNNGFLYHIWSKIAKNIDLKFYPSGHVLGGAIVVIRIKTENDYLYLGFSGDLGRRDGIILPPPEFIQEKINYWFSESTYGGLVHPNRSKEIERLINIAKKSWTEKKKILIPSFALERTQEIIYLLSYYMSKKIIPPLIIYLDSPMANKITSTFRKNWKTHMFVDQGMLSFNPFDTQENPYLETIDSKEESQKLLKKPAPHVIIAGSGMCDAGRIRNYLYANLNKEKTIICLVGYMAKDSLGRKLKDAWPIVKINGQSLEVKAEIVSFDSFSAHADSAWLSDYAHYIIKMGQLKKIFLIHGEEKRATKLKEEIIKKIAKPKNNYWLKNIIIPNLNQKINLF